MTNNKDFKPSLFYIDNQLYCPKCYGAVQGDEDTQIFYCTECDHTLSMKQDITIKKELNMNEIIRIANYYTKPTP